MSKKTTAVIVLVLCALGAIIYFDRSGVTSVETVGAEDTSQAETDSKTLPGEGGEATKVKTTLDPRTVAKIAGTLHVPTTTAPVADREPSAGLLSQERQGDGWGNNSWNVAFSTSSARGFSVTYKEAWSGFSFFSTKGLDLSKYSSIEVVLGAETEESVVQNLKLSVYRDKEELGTIPVAPYRISGDSVPTFRIPLADLKENTQRATDVYVMSAVPQQVDFLKMTFSQVEAVSQKALWNTPAPTGGAVLPTLPPAIDGYYYPAIYHSGLQNGWSVEGRHGLIIVDQADEVRSVTGKAIKMKYTDKEGLFVLLNPKGHNTKGMKYLQMKIYGGTLDYGWQQLNITLRDRTGAWIGRADNIMEYSGNGVLRSMVWNEISLPLSAFNATSSDLGSIEIGNFNTTQEGDYLWVDGVRLIEN